MGPGRDSFYSAAAQAGSRSWKALLFGSSDAANFITVDKAPAAVWLMAVSARLFGVNGWSILVPQALAGVVSVGLLYATVRRAARPAAGLLAGAVLALTPVAALMFRFNNPDAALLAGAAVVVALAGPGAYSVATGHAGAIPSAGPAGVGRFGPGGGGRGGIGGLLNGTTPSAALARVLGQDADRYPWVAATVGSNNAAGCHLATGDPVIAIGGFDGTDPAPTLEQFQAYVAAERIHWFVGGGMGGNGGTAGQITAWVTSSFRSTTVDGTTLYDLTTAAR